ncbi:MAG: hypothetical protein ABI634_06785 [Acidobacteriota bacterium]
MSSDGRLEFWLLVWIGTAAYILVRHWISGRGAGLVLTYVLSLAAIHWLAAAIYALPWYSTQEFDTTLDGLRISAIALMAFAVGAEFGALLFRRLGPEWPELTAPQADPRIVNLYIVTGVIFYSVIFPLVAALPTASALASTSSSLVVLGIGLKAWNAWHRGRSAGAWLWLASTAVFPFVTLVGQGFLGFGFAAMLVVAAFVASFYRPRWQVVAAGVLVAYLGLSIYVTYMRDRRDIREVVWGGESLGSRVGRLTETFAAMEWFDLQNIEHLHRIDDRLNQDALVGMAIDNIRSGAVPLARGGTIEDAALALIPRALWPAKPVVAGSGDLVAEYTGLVVPEGTSVGIGHVMEWYVNFATSGVVLGFMLIGAVTVYVDRSASSWLHRGDVSRFAIWFLPGLSVLQVGGSFVEMMSTGAAALVIALACSRLAARFSRPAPLRPSPVTASDR